MRTRVSRPALRIIDFTYRISTRLLGWYGDSAFFPSQHVKFRPLSRQRFDTQFNAVYGHNLAALPLLASVGECPLLYRGICQDRVAYVMSYSFNCRSAWSMCRHGARASLRGRRVAAS